MKFVDGAQFGFREQVERRNMIRASRTLHVGYVKEVFNMTNMYTLCFMHYGTVKR